MYDRSTRRISAPGWPLAGLLCGLLAGSAAYANPTGHTVVHGSAQFDHLGANTLNVTTSPNTIINWQDFSIDGGERTNFFQPSASSAVLNRVIGADPSSILGQLWSDGRVFLINPHGIVFGEGAVVDTAGLVASTLGISDPDFLAGRYRFDGGPDAGGIVNRGLIKAGADGVFLLAPSIENSGDIRTDGGDLVLAAGRTITLTSLDLDGVRVEVQAPEDEVLNLGDLIAKHGAAGVFAGSIRNSGTVEANAVTVDDDGTIRLVAQGDITLEAGGRVAAEGPSGGEVHVESKSGTTWVSGEVSVRASEGRGGTIRLLGRRVGLAGARVDASGPGGGGEVLVGGDVSGEGPVPTAESTYVSSDSAVSADALDDGDGGKVVVFASGFANVQGRLSARGGAQGGDGGFVETSGLESFVITRTPDTTAPNGDGGHWLIDPNDIEIVAGNGNTNINNTNPFESTDDSAQLGIDLIIAALTGDQSVTVQTREGGVNNEGGDITLNAAFDVESTTGTNTLTLDAHRDIVIRETISDASGGAVLNLVLDAEGDVWLVADVTLFDGSLRTEGEWVGVANDATVTLDGVTWDMNSDGLSIGSDAGALGTDNGTVVVRNGATIDAEDKWLVVGDESGTEGTLRIESGAYVTASWATIGLDAGSRGTVTVTGSGSSLTTKGTANTIRVGDEGTGTLHVLDGGLVDTHQFEVARSGVGRAVIRGVAADGTRSRVIASPANGKYSGVYESEGGFARVGRNAGSNGSLEILDGGLLRVLDGDGTHGPGFQLARNKGSVGTLLIDGEGSSLEVIQNAPATEGSDFVSSGPYAWLGRRGGGTTTIRNGGTLLMRGENAYVGVSRDSVFSLNPDPDPGPINQRSVVRIESGGRMEIDGDDGEYALLVIGDGGPNADGMVTVTGSGSALVTKGNDNRIRVGDEGTGTLHVLDGGLVDTLFLQVARSGVGRAVIRGAAADGTRSRVIVSPANGKFSGVFASEGGFARVGRNAGSNGSLEILDGGLLRVLDGDGTYGPGFQLARSKGSVGTLLIDGEGSSLEVIQNAPSGIGSDSLCSGPCVWLGRRGGGTTTVRNGGTLLVKGEEAWVGISRDSVNPSYPDPDHGPINQRSVVRIESGGRMEIDGEDGEYAILALGDGGPAADGMVTVTGSGSALVTKGNDNRIRVGDEGTGTLHVLDGGLVDTLFLEVGRRSVGRAVIRGVAADGTRSRVIVSPANGKFPGVFANEGGFVRVGHIAGSNGSLEILDGGLLRVLDGDGTHGPAFQLARYKDSVGTLLIDGEGSSLEVIQNARAVHGNPDVPPGPIVQLGRRGGGTTIIRNGGRLLVRGEHAYVQVSQDSIWERYPDPDPGPIHQRSVVRIESGGRMDIDGAGARLVIGDSGPAADGVVTVTGSGSALVLTGADNRLVVGDEGRGRLDVRDGGTALYGELVVGAMGTTNVSTAQELQEEVDAIVDDVLPERQGRAGDDGGAETGDEESREDEDDEEEDESEETAGVDEAGEEEQEELQMCPA